MFNTYSVGLGFIVPIEQLYPPFVYFELNPPVSLKAVNALTTAGNLPIELYRARIGANNLVKM